ncbi:hypothetical protein LOTGIDRAFT_158021 [Lottia gigantea]|uniref:Death domain-containing protein n=1 Tax=Lottia gigantea TaxID=225164 RepID=V4ATU2_LOTGI|nr:hypothetical protein LOTGIDRAFT_158021 [Lottia gigantea]ESP00728.1 hypothetical protein LOTGIDRAFT_158021 [Lottia gigantea]
MQAAEQKAIYQMSLTPGMAFITGPEGRKAEQEAINYDTDTSYRLVVNIVGRERQGKTSLRKLLSNDPFNEHEESTVGVDHELVDTTGLEPNPSLPWCKLDIRKANANEYDEILGKHVMIRLKRTEDKATKHRLAPLIVCIKICIITLLALCFFIMCSNIHQTYWIPWFGILMNLIFGVSSYTFGLTEGPGIAVGIRHLVVLTTAWFRWNLRSDLEFDHNWSVVFTTVILFVYVLALELFESVFLGLSLGVGLLCYFCLCDSPEPEMYLTKCPVSDPGVLLLLLGCLVGLVLHNFWNRRVITILATCLVVLCAYKPLWGITLTLATCNGVLHNVGLKVGQNFYCNLNVYLSAMSSSTRGRRLFRHVLGLVPGAILATLYGWKLSVSIPRVLVVICIILELEFFAYLKAKASKTVKENRSVNHPSKVISARTKSPRLKLVVRDFAGHPLYYDAHHVYMTGQCVYLLVFSLVEAAVEFRKVYQDIIQWLQSIRLHNRYPETRVFLVGTRRDDPKLSKCKVEEIAKELKRQLPRSYQNMLVWNHDDTPLFPVENSIRNIHDTDHKNLREMITQQTSDLTFRKEFPVKFFFFFNIIEHYRALNTLYDTFGNVVALCREMGLWFKTDQEFSEMLNVFQRTGEVMFRNDDTNQCDLIIFDPKALLNILCHIINIPRISERSSHLVADWSVLQDHGICSMQLFDHIFEDHSKGNTKEHVIEALARFNLICKISSIFLSEDVDSSISFLIPSCLPEVLPYQDLCWTECPEDQILYIKCQPYFPQVLFSRLVCVCVSFDESLMRDDSYPNVCKSKAVLTYRGKVCYQLELIRDDQTGLYDLIKIVVRDDVKNSISPVVLAIWQCLSIIVKQDFKMCSLSLGVLCHLPPPHDGNYSNHLLPIITSTTGDISSPNHCKSEFLCCGRKVKLRFDQILPIDNNNQKEVGLSNISVDKHRVKNLREQHILELPNHVFTTICDFLNPPNPLGHDWTLLAGLLGLTVTDVDMIRFKNSQNPCGAVLHIWCSRQPEVTLEVLTDLLAEMERNDVIETLADLGFDTN